jgi:putative hydrolase of the HAD superfamily
MLCDEQASTRIHAVLFALDGTLLDHHAAVAHGLTMWVPELVAYWGIDSVCRFWLELEAAHYQSVRLGHLTDLEHRRARIRGFLNEPHMTDNEADDCFSCYWACYVEGIRAFPDAERALCRATASGLKVGILINGVASDQALKIARTGLSRLHVSLFDLTGLPAAKPGPKAFNAVCSQLDVSPTFCLMIGDSLDRDILGARSAGLPVILIDRMKQAAPSKLRRPVMTVQGLDQISFTPKGTSGEPEFTVASIEIKTGLTD